MMKSSVKYIDTETAAAIFGVTKGTVTSYCRKGEIKGCKKDDKGKWLIPCDSIKPLTKKERITALQGILIVKNDPNKVNGWLIAKNNRKGLELTIKYLSDNGYILYNGKKKNSAVNVKKIQLTDKGIELAFGEVNSINKYISDCGTLIGLATQMASLYLQILSLK